MQDPEGAARPGRTVGPSRRDAVAGLADAIRRIDRDNDRIRAFVALADRDEQRSLAHAAAERLAAGAPRSPLDGVPIGVKDNIDTADLPTAMGSGLYADRIPPKDAPVVARLRAAGALIIGKTNLTELACGTEGTNDYFGDVLNPVMPDRFPGGSSSGSAAAIAAGMVPMTVGSDTSCSIRNPAASCGVVGLKPSRGRVPNDGVSVCNKLLDTVGPMAASCEDAAALLSVLQDPSWPDPVAALSEPLPVLRIGVLSGRFRDGCDTAVAGGLDRLLTQLRALGHELHDVDLGIDPTEADSQVNVLCRDMLAVYGQDVAAAPAGLVGREVRHWFAEYETVSDADYAAAMAYREASAAAAADVLRGFDVVICPTARTLPARIDRTANRAENGSDGDRADRAENCSVWNLAGLPSLSVPVRPSGPDGPPVGMLLNGAHGSDGRLLTLGAALGASGR
ncbi:MAG: amidase [Actinomycetota bacterium]